MNEILKNLRAELEQNANEKDKLAGQHFFKEEVTLLGMKTVIVTRIAKDHFRALDDKRKEAVFALCEELFRSGIMEESFVACNWSYTIHKQYMRSDFTVFEKWVSSWVGNWATCDTLCNHTVGTLIEMYPDLVNELKRWALSENRWVRRASAVSLIVPARKGLFLKDIFEIAGILLTDEDDMVRKGYGWMLKVASQRYEDEVFDFVMKNKAVMPRTALRYAIEKMSQGHKTQAMAR